MLCYSEYDSINVLRNKGSILVVSQIVHSFNFNTTSLLLGIFHTLEILHLFVVPGELIQLVLLLSIAYES